MEALSERERELHAVVCELEARGRKSRQEVEEERRVQGDLQERLREVICVCACVCVCVCREIERGRVGRRWRVEEERRVQGELRERLREVIYITNPQAN